MIHNKNFKNYLDLKPFGGIENVTKNMFVYEFGNDIMLVDCGIGFPDKTTPDEEFILPDFSYLEKNKHRIRGLVVTHAHFDHYGATPNLLTKISVPVFTSKLTAEFIKIKAKEMGIKGKHIDFRIIDPKLSQIKIGSFKVTPFHINHSVPEALGLFIETPIGNIFHVADYKFDFTPIDEEPFDIHKVSLLAANKKPVLLLSDCLGAAKEGHTQSEATIQEVLENIMIRAKGLMVVTTLSTNISRIKQAIKASANAGRKVAFVGRSLEQTSEIAKNLGYFSSLRDFVLPAKKIKRYPFSKLTIIAAGSYAQTNSALLKMSKNKHHLIKLKKDDVVVFSADPSPPGVLVGVNKMIDDLTRLGTRVYYYEIQDNLHVSGHGTAEDIKMLISITKPQYLMPIGGDYRHMAAFSVIAQKMGYQEKQVLLLREKQKIQINSQNQVIVNNQNG
ncbi:ribonuclease J [Patescibacteria group bacterium]